MATAKKYPEFELPPLLTATIKDYLGPARMAKLTASQRGRLAALANQCSVEVGSVIDEEPTPTDD